MKILPLQASIDPTQTRPCLKWSLAAAVMFLLSACATQPDAYREVAEPASPRLPPTQVYFYPAAGQTATQQDRDRYECYLWAVKQTGFDPGQSRQVANPRVDVVPVPAAGQDTVVGAFSGALLGAAVSRPRDAGEGAVIGAILGTMLGAASDASRQERAQEIQQRYDQRDALRYSQLERRAADYRRAMAACLEGRGYTVH